MRVSNFNYAKKEKRKNGDPFFLEITLKNTRQTAIYKKKHKKKKRHHLALVQKKKRDGSAQPGSPQRTQA